MNCPFCHCRNAATAHACRVCGGPLRATQSATAPISVGEPIPAVTEFARRNFGEDLVPLFSADFVSGENPRVCLLHKNGVVQLWNAQSDEVWSFSIRQMFRKFIPIDCALATENFLVTGHENGEVRWQNLKGRERKRSASHVGHVLAVAANETHLYSGGNDGVIWATALEDNRKFVSCALLEGLGALTTFAVSPDSNLIAVGCDDGAVQLWRVNAEKTAAKLDWTRSNHSAPIRSLMFSPNGQMIISRDRANALCLWAAQTSYQLPLSDGAQTSRAAPAFSADSRLLSVVDAKNCVSIFDVALGTLLRELPPSDETVTHLAFAPEAPWLLVAGERNIAVWELA